MVPALEAWRGRHAGATMVVAGCGVSLARLKAKPPCPVIGVNDVGRAFQPDYLVVLNTRAQFGADRFRHVAESRARAVFSPFDLGLPHPVPVRFALGARGGVDLSAPGRLPHTRNSPYVALCLALLMGARRVGLIGVDFADHHFFAADGAHPLARELASIDAEYQRLGAAAAAQGTAILNLGAESRLTAFPKADLDGFLAALAPRHLAATS